jgi:N-acetylglucosaminyl-diphospho-decaprenol L-rhamnosyltransferase
MGCIRLRKVIAKTIGELMNESPALSVVIVNYCTPHLVLKCVSSIVANGIAESERIVVVDNCSPDGSFTKLRNELVGVNVVQSKKNGGFGAGVNYGAQYCGSGIMLVLNPDTYFEDNSIQSAIDMFKIDPKAAIVGLDLVYPSGARQYSSRRFYSYLDIVGRRTPFGRLWPLKARMDVHLMKSSWDLGQPFEADWVMGTGFLVQKSIFAEVGGMDEGYFLYMEDVDLCARIWEAGYKVTCVPGARLVHDHQRSSSTLNSRAARSHLRSLLRFHGKFRVPVFKPRPRLPIVAGD